MKNLYNQICFRFYKLRCVSVLFWYHCLQGYQQLELFSIQLSIQGRKYFILSNSQNWIGLKRSMAQHIDFNLIYLWDIKLYSKHMHSFVGFILDKRHLKEPISVALTPGTHLPLPYILYNIIIMTYGQVKQSMIGKHHFVG